MDKATFCRILAEEGLTDEDEQNRLWKTRPSDELDEERLRRVCQRIRPELPGIRAQEALSRELTRQQQNAQSNSQSPS